MRLRTFTHCLSTPTAPPPREAGPAGALQHPLLPWVLPGAAPALFQPQGRQTVLEKLGGRKPSQRGAQGPGRGPSMARVQPGVPSSDSKHVRVPGPGGLLRAPGTAPDSLPGFISQASDQAAVRAPAAACLTGCRLGQPLGVLPGLSRLAEAEVWLRGNPAARVRIS